jgi:hypothetical protein
MVAHIVALLLGGSIMAGGLAILWRTCWLCRPGLSSRHWPSCQGTIVEAAIRQLNRVEIPQVRYVYTVDSQSYSATTVQFMLSEDAAAQAKRSYHPGAKVDVFYNPRRPQQATLQTGVAIAPLVPVITAATLLIGLGLGLTMLFW